jgi:hypothetical protein
MKIERIETLACDAGWRNYHFLKLVPANHNETRIDALEVC